MRESLRKDDLLAIIQNHSPNTNDYQAPITHTHGVNFGLSFDHDPAKDGACARDDIMAILADMESRICSIGPDPLYLLEIYGPES